MISSSLGYRIEFIILHRGLYNAKKHLWFTQVYGISYVQRLPTILSSSYSMAKLFCISPWNERKHISVLGYTVIWVFFFLYYHHYWSHHRWLILLLGGSCNLSFWLFLGLSLVVFFTYHGTLGDASGRFLY